MSATAVSSRPATSHIRWTVCALLFFATTINYVDRQVLSILAKTLETVWVGQKTPEVAMQQLQERWQKNLDQG